MSPDQLPEDLWRAYAPQVLAALVRRYGDFDAAEDAVQEALLAAYRQWPTQGVPDRPDAWLTTVASRRLVDQVRSERARSDRERQDLLRTPADEIVSTGTASLDRVVVDDSVSLLLLCCHPELSRPSQVALTLRAVGGLTTAQIARAFLVPEATMAQRISRAKSRLRRLDAPFATVSPGELPDRVVSVTQVLYVVFTEGHLSTAGRDLYDVSLSEEAIRLTRWLHARLPESGEITGLLALMLLTDARRASRLGPDGSLIPLDRQDRTRWDRGRLREGVALIEGALPVGRVGPYQLQAAIAAVHAEAGRAEDTDWAQIEVLYAMLATQAPGPVVTLNRAVAVAMVQGPEAGLRMIAPLASSQELRQNHRLPAVRAHLLALAGRPSEARIAYAEAARLATSIPEQRYLNERAAATSDRGTDSGR
ncbi:MAG TPA: sigma-70 family RNA polymerase sigma factor [Microlunatus sp.]|nr:sigma-70 family RNA polymerase sigma factor [Microlunatus sp.]